MSRCSFALFAPEPTLASVRTATGAPRRAEPLPLRTPADQLQPQDQGLALQNGTWRQAAGPTSPHQDPPGPLQTGLPERTRGRIPLRTRVPCATPKPSFPSAPASWSTRGGHGLGGRRLTLYFPSLSPPRRTPSSRLCSEDPHRPELHVAAHLQQAHARQRHPVTEVVVLGVPDHGLQDKGRHEIRLTGDGFKLQLCTSALGEGLSDRPPLGLDPSRCPQAIPWLFPFPAIEP